MVCEFISAENNLINNCIFPLVAAINNVVTVLEIIFVEKDRVPLFYLSSVKNHATFVLSVVNTI